MMETRDGLSTEFISHPGDTLLELLEQYGVSQKELAIKTETSEKHINEIIKGKKGISTAFAKKLENVFKPDASFWLNRQQLYDEKIESIKIKKSITDSERTVIKDFPISELIAYGYLEETRNETETILMLRKFSAVSNLIIIEDLLEYQIATASFKTDNTKSQYNPFKLYSWLRICQIETEHIYNPNEYDVDKLKASLPIIKRLSREKDINHAIKQTTEILYECGINFKIVRSFKGLSVQGFIKTIGSNISLCTTVKWHREDVFWFLLFHEFGHLLSRRNNRIFLDMSDYNEFTANEFAENYLINKQSYKELIDKPINEDAIIKCAKTNDVCPAIVVGRLKHDKVIKPNEYNHLIRKINF